MSNLAYNTKPELPSGYTPFGSVMKGREFIDISGFDGYRYGFNGQEKDNNMAGMGNINTAEFWEYDTRLGRRWNMDPKPDIALSDYACFRNSLIIFCDPLEMLLKLKAFSKD